MARWNPEKLKNHKGMSGKIGFWTGKKRVYKNPEERAIKISEGLQRAYQNGIRPKVFAGKPEGFKKGSIPWNKDKIGVMPTAWNKGTKGICKANSGSIKKGENRLAILSCVKQSKTKEPT